jgi:hypothetical protein
MTSHALAAKLLEGPDLEVVVSDDPGDGFTFRPANTKPMFLTREGMLYDSLQDKAEQENPGFPETLEGPVLVIIP